jgi:DNA-directed RNA polymerase specialized sigma24 family protein
MNTTSDDRSPFLALENALDDEDVRASISSTIRRAVPASDADDISQGVFCDALEATTLPKNRLEIPFWLVGIARHRVADYFRRRPREVLGLTPEGSTPPATFESREALDHVAARLRNDADAKKTLEWMVLEHDGVPFKTIARREKLSPAAVRARVYRLRTRLRRELGYLLVGILLALGVGAALHARQQADSAARDQSAGTTPAWAQGDFAVVRATLSEGYDAATRAKLESEALDATISLRGSTLDVRTATRHKVLTLSLTSHDDAFVAAATDDTGRIRVFSIRIDGEEVFVESSAGALKGTLVLKRLAALPQGDPRK